MVKYITLPVREEQLRQLHAGDIVAVSGAIYTARDAAHKRMMSALERGEALPFDVEGQGIYYLGPAPAKPGQIIGSAGPTSSYRMDRFTPPLLERGLKVMIGKGRRSQDVIESMVRHQAIYLAATGGAAALMTKAISGCEVVAYDDLGPEAVRRLELHDLPVTVAVDCYGVDWYKEGPNAYLNGKKDY